MGIYGFLVASILLVYALGFSAAVRSARSVSVLQLPGLELGKLLVITLAAFMVDRMRRLNEQEPPAGSCAGARAGDVGDRSAGPRLRARVPGGPAGRAACGRHALDPLRGPAESGLRGDRDRRGGGARRGHRGAQAVPDGSPHRPSSIRPRILAEELPDQPVTTARFGSRKTGRGDEAAITPTLPDINDLHALGGGEEFGFVGQPSCCPVRPLDMPSAWGPNDRQERLRRAGPGASPLCRCSRSTPSRHRNHAGIRPHRLPCRSRAF